MTTDLLLGVRVKIDRAKKHCRELESEIARFNAGNPYALVDDTHPETGKPIYRFRFLTPIPKDWGGYVGDIIHNLRAALDNLATASALHHDPTIGRSALKDVYFPIGATKEAFDRRLQTDLKRASERTRKIVKRLKPYKGGADAFWRLHQLDILDKHTALVPVGLGRGQMRIKLPPVRFPKSGLREFPVIPVNLKKAYPLQDGHILPIPEVVRTSSPGVTASEEKPQLQFTFEVAFGEGQIVDGEPLIPTLKQFIDFVERVVQIFERHVFK
jgi:hypothetical protein